MFGLSRAFTQPTTSTLALLFVWTNTAVPSMEVTWLLCADTSCEAKVADKCDLPGTCGSGLAVQCSSHRPALHALGGIPADIVSQCC